MKRIIKNPLLTFILGLIISGSVVYAATLIASDITYDNTKTSMNANNVQDAIEELYDMASNGDTPTGPTKLDSINGGETYKGIVYLDPTNLNKSCNPLNSISTTETKEGCMKWYIFDDSGDNYKMILDHNTTARIKWNDDNINVAYELSNLKPVVDDLVTTNKWKVTPRLITAAEVLAITGKSGFDANNINSWYYLDTNSQTMGSFNSKNRSRYAWLYNNLNKCKSNSTDYGCSIEDANTYQGVGTAGGGTTWAYWTSTPVGNAGSGSDVWYVRTYGDLFSYVNGAECGVRPVIEISKSIVD